MEILIVIGMILVIIKRIKTIRISRQEQQRFKKISINLNVTGKKESNQYSDVNLDILGKEQQFLYEKMENTRESMYITGKAGTGKSFLLKFFASNTRKTVAVVAPTGIAALNIGGQTIHSLFQLDFGVQYPKQVGFIPTRLRTILKNIDVLVIDEVSMVRVDIFAMINRKMQVANNNNLPFGGKQVIMFGDLFQIPPVITDGQISRYLEDTYGGIFFFNSSIYNENAFKTYELSEMFRQKDKKFIDILNRIRIGRPQESDFVVLNKRYNLEACGEGILTLVTTNAKASEINTRKLDNIQSKEYSYNAEITGDILRGDYPTEATLKLKVGAQVMMIKNDNMESAVGRGKSHRRWVNGTLGIITYLSEDIVKVAINGVEHIIDKASWEKYRYEYDEVIGELKKEKIGEFRQYPVKLAWAITIHKSQGMTYQNVLVDMGRGAFECGQTYVALSRCIDLNNLYLKTKLYQKDIKTSQQIIDFMNNSIKTDIN